MMGTTPSNGAHVPEPREARLAEQSRGLPAMAMVGIAQLERAAMQERSPADRLSDALGCDAWIDVVLMIVAPAGR